MSTATNAQRLSVVPDEVSRQMKSVSAAEEVTVCSVCFGTGMEVITGKGARRCGCRARAAQAKLLDAARIPRRFAECSFSNYRPAEGNGSQFRALGLAHRLVKEYPAVDRGLLLMGPCGVGKTHLSVGILRGLTEKGVGCLFYEFGALLKDIQISYNPVSQTSESDVLAPIYETEILVLDELAAVRPTDWVKDMMMHVIGTRYNDQRLTIFTTNYTDERRRSEDETLEDRVGIRLRSRLYEMCRTVILEGEDYRYRFND